MWEIVPNFVVFLENLNFKGRRTWFTKKFVIRMKWTMYSDFLISNLGRRRRMWLLDEVPQAPLVLCKLAGAKVLLNLLLNVGRLLLHLVLDELLAGVELVLTTGL